jgi:hypothetical protein
MGYYIQVPMNKGKTEQLINLYDAEEITLSCFEDIPKGKSLICVIDNGSFEACAYCYSPSELKEFQSVSRPRRWLLMEESLVKKLSGFKEEK